MNILQKLESKKWLVKHSETHRLMLHYGATSVYKLGIGNDDTDNIVEYFNTWKRDIWGNLKKAFGAKEILPKKPSNEEVEGEEDILEDLPVEAIMTSFHSPLTEEQMQTKKDGYSFKLSKLVEHQPTKILSISELREDRKGEEGEDSTKMVELEWPEGRPVYQTAGNISIYPHNSAEKVERIKEVLNNTFELFFTIKEKDGSKKPTLPSPISLDTLLRQHIDLSGKITQGDILTMKKFLKKSSFERVEAFLEKKVQASESCDLVDLMEGVKLSGDKISFMLSLGKSIEPRSYTICSSAIVSPRIIQIAVSTLYIKGENTKRGLFSQFIHEGSLALSSDAKKVIRVRTNLTKSSFTLPSNPKTPV